MITKEEFARAENLPSELASRLDRPWHFVGEINVKMLGPASPLAVCRDCFRPSLEIWDTGPPEAIEMKRHLFITDDLLICAVYFGICPQCDCVYWARQAPPFRRIL